MKQSKLAQGSSRRSTPPFHRDADGQPCVQHRGDRRAYPRHDEHTLVRRFTGNRQYISTDSGREREVLPVPDRLPAGAA
jgi:hypothetical protein